MPILPDSACYLGYGNVNSSKSDKVCAGYTSHGLGLCKVRKYWTPLLRRGTYTVTVSRVPLHRDMCADGNSLSHTIDSNSCYSWCRAEDVLMSYLTWRTWLVLLTPT